MRIAASGARRRTLLALTCAFIAIATGAIAAAGGEARGTSTNVTAELRIEGPKGNIDPGTLYETGTERIKRSRGLSCKHRPGRITVNGPTALGIAATASDERKDLPPLRVRSDDFGLFVCELGGFIGRPFDDPQGFSGWIYWVDYAGGTQSAELETLGGGEQVLWVFSDYDKQHPLNTGDALELSEVPPYDADGQFTVHVDAHAYDGSPSAFDDAAIKGAASYEALGSGDYQVTVPSGITTLWAKHRPDIASNRLRVCVEASPDACP